MPTMDRPHEKITGPRWYRWLMRKLLRKSCRRHRAEFFTIKPPAGKPLEDFHPQVLLQITHVCDGVPLGRVYLGTARMRELCKYGLRVCDDYEMELAFERLHRQHGPAANATGS